MRNRTFSSDSLNWLIQYCSSIWLLLRTGAAEFDPAAGCSFKPVPAVCVGLGRHVGIDRCAERQLIALLLVGKGERLGFIGQRDSRNVADSRIFDGDGGFRGDVADDEDLTIRPPTPTYFCVNSLSSAN